MPKLKQQVSPSEEKEAKRKENLHVWGFDKGDYSVCHKCGKHARSVSDMIQCAKCKEAYWCRMKCFQADMATHLEYCKKPDKVRVFEWAKKEPIHVPEEPPKKEEPAKKSKAKAKLDDNNHQEEEPTSVKEKLPKKKLKSKKPSKPKQESPRAVYESEEAADPMDESEQHPSAKEPENPVVSQSNAPSSSSSILRRASLNMSSLAQTVAKEAKTKVTRSGSICLGRPAVDTAHLLSDNESEDELGGMLNNNRQCRRASLDMSSFLDKSAKEEPDQTDLQQVKSSKPQPPRRHSSIRVESHNEEEDGSNHRKNNKTNCEPQTPRRRVSVRVESQSDEDGNSHRKTSKSSNEPQTPRRHASMRVEPHNDDAARSPRKSSKSLSEPQTPRHRATRVAGPDGEVVVSPLKSPRVSCISPSKSPSELKRSSSSSNPKEKDSPSSPKHHHLQHHHRSKNHSTSREESSSHIKRHSRATPKEEVEDLVELEESAGASTAKKGDLLDSLDALLSSDIYRGNNSGVGCESSARSQRTSDESARSQRTTGERGARRANSGRSHRSRTGVNDEDEGDDASASTPLARKLRSRSKPTTLLGEGDDDDDNNSVASSSSRQPPRRSISRRSSSASTSSFVGDSTADSTMARNSRRRHRSTSRGGRAAGAHTDHSMLGGGDDDDSEVDALNPNDKDDRKAALARSRSGPIRASDNRRHLAAPVDVPHICTSTNNRDESESSESCSEDEEETQPSTARPQQGHSNNKTAAGYLPRMFRARSKKNNCNNSDNEDIEDGDDDDIDDNVSECASECSSIQLNICDPSNVDMYFSAAVSMDEVNKGTKKKQGAATKDFMGADINMNGCDDDGEDDLTDCEGDFEDQGRSSFFKGKGSGAAKPPETPKSRRPILGHLGFRKRTEGNPVA